MSKHQPPTLFPESAHQQEFDLFKHVMAMMNGDVAEWLRFVDMVKELRDAQRFAEYGVPHSKKKAEAAARPVDNFLREIAEYQKMPTLDFNSKGGVS